MRHCKLLSCLRDQTSLPALLASWCATAHRSRWKKTVCSTAPTAKASINYCLCGHQYASENLISTKGLHRVIVVAPLSVLTQRAHRKITPAVLAALLLARLTLQRALRRYATAECPRHPLHNPCHTRTLSHQARREASLVAHLESTSKVCGLVHLRSESAPRV